METDKIDPKGPIEHGQKNIQTWQVTRDRQTQLPNQRPTNKPNGPSDRSVHRISRYPFQCLERYLGQNRLAMIIRTQTILGEDERERER